MARMTYVWRDGKLIEKHLAAAADSNGNAPGSPGFIPDIEPFVSPIDGSVISSRSQYRDHCKRHDVVPTAELAGLPSQRTPAARTRQDQEQLKRQIADLVYRR